MIDEIYNFLKEYGFSEIEIKSFYEKNEKMYFTNLVELDKNIKFFVDMGLSNLELLDVIRKNPFMLTVKNNRLDAFNKIYFDELGYDKNIVKDLIIKNVDTYTCSPIELNKNIEYLKDNRCSLDTIKDFIINNSFVISLTLDEFKKNISFKEKR